MAATEKVTKQTQPTEDEINAFVHKAFGDIGAMLTAALVVIGDECGLYKALAAHGPMTPAELAKRTNTSERCVREWCAGQAAAEYIAYDPATGRYELLPAQAVALVDESSPACMLGGFQGMSAATRAVPKIVEAFRSGKGLGWHEHDPGLFRGTERFFRPGYNAHLVNEWIPALEGVKSKLEKGARVADVGCGHGASTVIMAKAFPRSKFTGFDYHEPSIARARTAAREAGVAEQTKFEVAAAKNFPGTGYDLIAFFDCLHDMGDPVGAARHVREALAPDGTWLLVEPFANDKVEDNLNPIGRVFYSVSTLVCTQASLSQEVGLALGAQAGEERLKEVLHKAGFTRVRRATETPFNLVIEARP
jgi:ubiquinone/menaquinone biosynthesis C-methylase UbiE